MGVLQGRVRCGWMCYKGGSDVGGCATREGVMWVDVVQGRV